jgi:thymidylate synthase (FAD)
MRNLVQTGKPGHYEFIGGTDSQYATVMAAITENSEYSWGRYERMLNQGIAKEVARMVLPLNIYTSFYATCNARSLMHFLGLRTENESATFKSHPQKEIQMVADKMEALFAEHMPITYKAWSENGRVAP